MRARKPWLDRLLHGAVYGVVLTMPFSVLYPLTAPLGPGDVELYVTPGLELVDIPAGLLLLLAALDGWLRRGEPFPRPKLIFARLVLLVAALGAASIVGAEAPGLAAYTTMRWLLAGALLWAIVRARVAPQRLVYILGLSLCVHAALGFLQVWHASPIGLPGELALDPGQQSAAVVHLGKEVWLRGYGMTFHPNVLGGYFAVALILLLPLLSSRLPRIIAYVLVAGLAATLSRSAGLALLLVVPVFVWWLWRTDSAARPGLRRTAKVFSCVAVLCVAILWKPITVRLNPLLIQLGVAHGEPVRSEQGSLRSRQRMNEVAIDLMFLHPILGIGAGNFPVAMVTAETRMVPQYVHNVPLLLGAEVGIGGLLTWLAMAVWAGVMLARGTPNVWTTAGAAAWWVLVIVSLFDCYPWSLNAGRVLTVTVLALLEGVTGVPSRRGANPMGIAPPDVHSA